MKNRLILISILLMGGDALNAESGSRRDEPIRPLPLNTELDPDSPPITASAAPTAIS
jgi:hypothetical protein